MSAKAISNVTNNWFKNTNKKLDTVETMNSNSKANGGISPSEEVRPVFTLGGDRRDAKDSTENCSSSDESLHQATNTNQMEKNLSGEIPTHGRHNLDHMVDIQKLTINHHHERELVDIPSGSMALPVNSSTATTTNPQICFTRFDPDHHLGGGASAGNNNEYFRSVFMQ